MMILLLHIFRATDVHTLYYQQIAEQISVIHKDVGVVPCISV